MLLMKNILGSETLVSQNVGLKPHFLIKGEML